MIISINCNLSIAKLDGSHARISYFMIYLGGLISDVCVITSELSRRIGMAYNDFSGLQRV